MANGKTSVSSKEKSEMLNEQFASVFTRDESAGAPSDLGPLTFQEMAKMKFQRKK